MKQTITLLVGLGVFAGCASSKPAPTADPAPRATLFDRLGGSPVIEAMVDDFLARVAGDERINAGYAGSDLPRVRRRTIELFCASTGGGCPYTGRDMKTVHAGMGITPAQFEALAGHLVETLNKLKVADKEKRELLAIVGKMQQDIVEQP